MSGDKVKELLKQYFQQYSDIGYTSIVLDRPISYVEKQEIPQEILPQKTLQPTQKPQTVQNKVSSKNETVQETIATLPKIEKNHDKIRKELAELYYSVNECTSCQLSNGRNRFVFGAGNASADILIIGEGPGYEEDMQGKPFVGPAGQLLTKMLSAININREEVFISNIVKCRPPGNRTPSSEEVVSCMPILKRQIAIIQPKAILLLGKTAISSLLNSTSSVTTLRGKKYNYNGIATFVTYHPAALLRNISLKRAAWDDLKFFKSNLGELL